MYSNLSWRSQLLTTSFMFLELICVMTNYVYMILIRVAFSFSQFIINVFLYYTLITTFYLLPRPVQHFFLKVKHNYVFDPFIQRDIIIQIIAI